MCHSHVAEQHEHAYSGRRPARSCRVTPAGWLDLALKLEQDAAQFFMPSPARSSRFTEGRIARWPFKLRDRSRDPGQPCVLCESPRHPPILPPRCRAGCLHADFIQSLAQSSSGLPWAPECQGLLLLSPHRCPTPPTHPRARQMDCASRPRSSAEVENQRGSRTGVRRSAGLARTPGSGCDMNNGPRQSLDVCLLSIASGLVVPTPSRENPDG